MERTPYDPTHKQHTPYNHINKLLMSGNVRGALLLPTHTHTPHTYARTHTPAHMQLTAVRMNMQQLTPSDTTCALLVHPCVLLVHQNKWATNKCASGKHTY